MAWSEKIRIAPVLDTTRLDLILWEPFLRVEGEETVVGERQRFRGSPKT
jgi:hypothetical protein